VSWRQGIIFVILIASQTLSAGWVDKFKKKKPIDRVNPTQFKVTDPCCKDLKNLNKQHKNLEKESFYESVALLTLLTKKDIKERLPQIPPDVLKATINEMHSTYVWMERAAKHPKTPTSLRDHLEKTLLPRSKYLVNAMAELIHQYDKGRRGARSALGHAGSNRKVK
jgi:hypothetical protein